MGKLISVECKSVVRFFDGSTRRFVSIEAGERRPDQSFVIRNREARPSTRQTVGGVQCRIAPAVSCKSSHDTISFRERNTLHSSKTFSAHGLDGIGQAQRTHGGVVSIPR